MTTPVSGTIARDDSLVELMKRSKEDLRRCLCLDAQRNAHHLHCKNRCNKLETCPYGQALLMKMGMRDVPESIARQLTSEQEKPVKVEPIKRPRHGLIQQVVLNGDYATYRMDNDKMVVSVQDSLDREYTAESIEGLCEIVDAWRILTGKNQSVTPAPSQKIDRRRSWTKAEEQIVLDNMELTSRQLKKLLPEKDVHAIECRKYKLKKEMGL